MKLVYNDERQFIEVSHAYLIIYEGLTYLLVHLQRH